MRDLKEIRTEIDEIDNRLIELFCRRMDCAKDVAAYKKANGIPILNQQREDEILAEAEQKGGAYGAEAKQLFETMMALSRALQQSIIDS